MHCIKILIVFSSDKFNIQISPMTSSVRVKNRSLSGFKLFPNQVKKNLKICLYYRKSFMVNAHEIITIINSSLRQSHVQIFIQCNRLVHKSIKMPWYNMIIMTMKIFAIFSHSSRMKYGSVS